MTVAQSRRTSQPTRTEQLGRWFVILLLVGTVAVELAAPVVAWRWVQWPFPGVLFEHTLVISGVYSESWQSDFPKNPSARLVAVDGRPVANSRDLSRVLQAYAPGDPVALTFEPRDGSAPIVVESVVQDFPVGAWLAQFWLPYAVGLVYLGIGIWVFRHRGHRRLGQSFALFCAFVALATGTLFDLNSSHVFTRIWTASLPLIAAALVHLALVFPEEGPLTRSRPLIRFLAYPLALVLVVVAQVRLVTPGDPWAYITFWRWGYAALAVAVVAFFALMLYTRARTLSSIVRQQVRIILLGSFLAFAPIAVYMVLAGLAIEMTFYPLLYLPPLVIFPLFIAYAILRYKLLGMDLVVSRGLAYSILVAVGAGAYFLALTAVGQILGIGQAPSGATIRALSWFLALFVAVLVLLLHPLREQIEALVDRLLGRQRVDYRQVLQGFSRELATTPLDLSAILHRLLGRIEPASHSAPALVFVRDPRLGRYVLHQASGFVGPADQEVAFEQDGELAAWLTEQDGPLYLQAVETRQLATRLSAEEWQQVESLDLALFLPLRGQRQLSGWVALGHRLSGEPYSPDDLNFLAALADQTAIAVENAQLLDSLEEQVVRLDVLRQIGEAVDLRRDLEELLGLIYRQTCRVLDVDNFYVALYDELRQEFHMAYYVEEGERREPPNPRWPLGTGLTGQIVRQRQPIVTDDYLAECQRRGVASGGKPAQAWLGVPLAAADRTLGVLNVSSFDPNCRYNPEQVQLMGAIADQAATAIDRMRLYQETEIRAAELATLYEVSRTINSTLDLPSVLDLIMNKVIELLNVEAGSLLLLDEEQGDLVFQVALGAPDSQKLIGRRHPVGRGIVGDVLQSGRAQIVNDVQADPRWDRAVDADIQFATRSVLCVPMISRERVIGVIEVINPRSGSPFRQDEAELLTGFAAQAAVAIENARLYTQTDQALARRVEELSTMQRIDRELNAALDFERVMDMTIEWALRRTNAPVGVMALYDERQQGLLLLASQGYPADFERFRKEPWPLDQGIIGRVVRSGAPVLVADVTEDPDYFPAQPTTCSQVSVPIRREDRVIGVVNLESPELAAFDQDDLAFVQRLADHAAIAIENARLHAETQKHLQVQVALREAGAAISSALDLEVVLSRIAEQMGRAVDATSAYICDYDSTADTSTVMAEYISAQACPQEKMSDLGVTYHEVKGDFLEMLRAGGHDLSQVDDPDLDGDERGHMEEYGAKTILYVPLKIRGRLIGYTELWESRRRREFTPDEISLCQGIAQQAAIALENARLYQESQRRAEDMTLLYDISLTVSSHLALDEVLEAVYERLRDVWDPPVFFIALYDEGEDALDFSIYVDRGGRLAPFRQRLAEKSGFSAWIVRNRKPLLIMDWQKEAETSPVQGIPVGELTRSWLGVPLLVGDRLVGVMAVQDYAPNVYGDEHRRFLFTIASEVAIAIENARLHESVQEANQAKSEFIDFVAHELKQPMTAMQGYAKMLTMGIGGELTDTQRQFVEVITSNVDRMGKLVNDLLEISRLEAGRTKLKLAPVRLNEVVEETIINTRTEIKARKHKLEVSAPEDLPPILGDRERLVQILTNLVSNAYKYTPEGGIIRITVNGRDSADVPPGHLCVAVSDTGIGMSPQELAHLEEKFFRADHDLVQQQPGTGLGVSITRNLVALHGGEFLIESEPGAGSTFRFTVPIAPEAGMGTPS